MKLLIQAAALTALMSMPALAQDAATPNQSPAAVGAQTPAASQDTMAKSQTGQVSAKRIMNKAVKNAANETIGDINDIVIDADGKVVAVIVGVGGFLGLGEKDVALPFDQLTFAKDADGGLVASTPLSSDALKSAPEYVSPDSRS
ncbi:MAG: PRC-barrel domain-containing protein [Hyphomicrobium sp.]|jgi:sporulation protein YlmC with PRC-barrel domain